MPATYLLAGRCIVVIGRRPRSKWLEVTCCGCGRSRRRRDGSCRHEREVLEAMTPEARKRARWTGG